MKAIKNIVQEMGLELNDEQVAELDKKVRENYVTRSEFDEKLTRIETLNSQVADLSETLKGSEDANAQIEQLNAQLKEFEDAENERVQKEAEARAKHDFLEEFTKALGDKKFANDMTQEHVFDKSFAMRKENPQMGAEDILKQVVGEQSDVWANPQASVKNQPSHTGNNSQADMAAYVARLFKG